MEHRILPFLQRMNDLLDGHLSSVHLYGSCVMDDFHPGWSDIDILCLQVDIACAGLGKTVNSLANRMDTGVA